MSAVGRQFLKRPSQEMRPQNGDPAFAPLFSQGGLSPFPAQAEQYALAYSALIAAAHNRSLCTYTGIAYLTGLPTIGAAVGKQVGHLVGEISEDEHNAGRPMLSALVVEKGTGMPSSGFYDLAQNLGLLRGTTKTAKKVFLRNQQTKLFAFWKQDDGVGSAVAREMATRTPSCLLFTSAPPPSPRPVGKARSIRRACSRGHSPAERAASNHGTWQRGTYSCCADRAGPSALWHGVHDAPEPDAENQKKQHTH